MDLKRGPLPQPDRPEWPPEPSILEVALDALGMTLEAAREALDEPGGYEIIEALLEGEEDE